MSAIQPSPFHIKKFRPKGIPYMSRLPSGLWSIEGRVVCCLYDENGELQIRTEVMNTVTNIGDRFYGYRGANEQPADDHFTTGAALTFDGIMELYKGVTAAPSKGAVRSGLTGGTLITGSAQAMDSGYPKSNDTDTANTGKDPDAVTYKVSYGTADANDTSIDDVIITNPSPTAGDNMLMWADGLGSFTKTTSDTLIVYVNHQMTG
jgi:hypothetical protein